MSGHFAFTKTILAKFLASYSKAGFVLVFVFSLILHPSETLCFKSVEFSHII